MNYIVYLLKKYLIMYDLHFIFKNAFENQKSIEKCLILNRVFYNPIKMPHPILFTLNLHIYTYICRGSHFMSSARLPFLFLSSLPLSSVSGTYHSPSSSSFCRFQCLQLHQHFKLVLLFHSCVNFHFLHFKCSSHLSIKSKVTPPPPPLAAPS